MEDWWWLQGRRFQLWQCVRNQTENREDCPPPLSFFYFYFLFNFYFLFYFYFLLFLDFFAMFYVAVFCIFYVYNFWDSRYRKKKKKGLHIGQPQGSLSESRWFVFKLFYFSCLHFLVACLL